MNELQYRIAMAIIFLLCFLISGYFRWKADRQTGEILARSKDGKPLATVIKIGGVFLWLTPIAYIVNPAWLSWSKMMLPNTLRFVGLLISVGCPMLFYWLFSHIGNNISPTSATRSQHQLVTTGPYRWIRHPLYTFGLLLFIGFGLLADNWLFLFLGLITFMIMAIRTPKEEANLIDKFGEDYLKYMQQTGRFFPKLPDK